MQLRATRLTSIAHAVRNLFAGASLNLNFAQASTLDPRITFTRASNATVTGPDGTLGYAPHNLLTHSEQFDNAAWTKSNATVTANATTAPDGSLTADKLVENDLSGVHRITPAAATVVAGTIVTTSVYAKASERAGVGVFPYSSAAGARFNLATGAVISQDPGVTASIVSVGSGWYRCSSSIVAPASSAAPWILPLNASNATNYTGDGTSGIFIWGAQLNIGPLQPYYPTTVKNALGYSQEFDNAAWTKSNAFVQTNLLTFSEQFDNAAWTRAAGSGLDANSARAPDGVNSADKFSVGTSTFPQISETVNASVPLTHAGSIYCKAAGLNFIQIRVRNFSNAANYFRVVVNLIDGTVSLASGFGAGTLASVVVTSAGDGWWRIGLAGVADTSGTSLTLLAILSVDAAGTVATPTNSAATDGVLLWGAQLVQGSTPGDYQRTEAAAKAVMYPAPDGSLTADLIEKTATAFASLVQGGASTALATQTGSVYVKSNGTLSRVSLALVNSTSATVIARGTIDLTTGAITNFTGNGLLPAVNVGDGWWRVAIRGAAVDASTRFLVYPDQHNFAVAGGIFIWGAQLSDSASIDPYVYNPEAAPTAQAYYGPRFDYDPVTLAPKGLLIEEQRTNSIRNSVGVGAVAGTPGTLPTNWTFNAGSTGISSEVIGTGAEGGVSYIDIRYSGTAAATASFSQRLESANSISALTGQTWSMSAWVKAQAGSLTGIAAINHQYIENTSSGVFVTSTNVPIVVDSTLTRQATSRTLSGGATVAFLSGGISVTVISGAAIDITLRIGLPQLELGAFATSPIPTTTAAATRAADAVVMTGANFSNWYSQSEGTLFAEVQFGQDDVFVNAIALAPTFAAASTLINMRRGSSGSFGFNIVDGGVIQAGLPLFGEIPKNSVAKLAGAYMQNDFAASANGGSFTQDFSGVAPIVDRLVIGGAWNSTTQTIANEFINGHIRRIAYFPRRLSNSELEGITK